ncbi:MAG: ribonuclease HII [Bdellovibrionota bacterium]|nr:ribonuclease HII [Bdellovibrionota bacterium]
MIIEKKLIAGIDEVGRGPLVGPVVISAVILGDYNNNDITDSKKLSPKKREILSSEIKNNAFSWVIVSIGPDIIEEKNILGATLYGMKIAAEKVGADYLLIDGNQKIDTKIPQETVVKGDLLCKEISAASIIAKVWRDNYMKELARNYPQYGFEKHAGYPTKAHIEVIKQYGPTKFHRQAFRGVKEFTESNSFFENYKENVVLYQKENKNSHDFGIYWEMGGKRSL